MHYKTWTTGPTVGLTLYGSGGLTHPQPLVGIIDTGATIVGVDSRITKQLGLSARHRKDIEVADGRKVTCGVYYARMTIPELEYDDYVQICGIDMPEPSHRLLLGRNFLGDYNFNYEGLHDRFTFHRVVNDARVIVDEFDE